MEALSKRLEVTSRQKTDSEDMVKRLSAENTYVSSNLTLGRLNSSPCLPIESQNE